MAESPDTMAASVLIGPAEMLYAMLSPQFARHIPHGGFQAPRDTHQVVVREHTLAAER
jgi:hypothetical protein